MDRELTRNRQRLDALFARARDLPPDPELQSHWARYLCVLVAGFVEVAMCHLYSDYARRTASPKVARYVSKGLGRPTNQNAARVTELAHAFSEDWGHQLKLFLEGQHKDALDSLVANRNQIAHGRSVGLTLTTLRDYYRSAIAVVEWVETACR